MIIRLILGVHDYGIMSLSSSSTAAVPATTIALPAMAHRRGGVAASLGSTQSEKKGECYWGGNYYSIAYCF